jgi:hypothetical protein
MRSYRNWGSLRQRLTLIYFGAVLLAVSHSGVTRSLGKDGGENPPSLRHSCRASPADGGFSCQTPALAVHLRMRRKAVQFGGVEFFVRHPHPLDCVDAFPAFSSKQKK